jgi:acyl transferase domain-containing protein
MPQILTKGLVLAGPCIGMDTACSSSLVATHLAHRGLLDGETSAAVAAGVNLMLVPDTSTHMAQLGALSPVGRSKSLDADADGYGRGEGCIAITLRRSEEGRLPGYSPLAVLQGMSCASLHASRPTSQVHCGCKLYVALQFLFPLLSVTWIKLQLTRFTERLLIACSEPTVHGAGSAYNQAGRSSGLTAPNGPAQTALVRTALAVAQLTPQDVALISMHGTGTPLGDPIEVGALGQGLAAGPGMASRVVLGESGTAHIAPDIGHCTTWLSSAHLPCPG